MAAMNRPSSSVAQPHIFKPESDPEEGGEAPAEPQTQRIQQDASEWLVKKCLSICFGTYLAAISRGYTII